MSESGKLKIDIVEEVLSETRIKKVSEPFTAILVIWDNINTVGNKRELIRIGNSRWNTDTSRYASANYDRLVGLTKEAIKRYNARRTWKIKQEQVWIEGVLKHQWRCPKCGRAAPDDFCMVHGDVNAVDILKDEKIRQIALENTPSKRGLEEHVLEYLAVKGAQPFISGEWLAKQERLGKTFLEIKPRIDDLIEDYFETEARVKELENQKEQQSLISSFRVRFSEG